MVLTGCQHPKGSVYWSEDEWLCRTCGHSLTYPPRPPGKDEKPDSHSQLLRCSGCEQYLEHERFSRSLKAGGRGRNYRCKACMQTHESNRIRNR